MTNKEYVDTLKHIASIPTKYNNKYPYNLGYWDGSKFSFDCWNLIKSVINGWTDTRTVGYYCKSFKVTGDIDGATILAKCTKKGTDFTQLSIPGTYLYMNGHAGTYIGETTINGKTYNVIECTASWDKKVLYSWVDPNGTRRRYKDATTSNKKWTNWGLMCWINYAETTPATTTTQPTSTTSTPASAEIVYTVKAGDTLSGIATKYNVKGGYQALAAYNGIKDPSKISVGQKIKIPSDSNNTTATTTKVYPKGTTTTRLNVRKGAGMGYSIVRVLEKGVQITIYEEKSGWGRIGTNEWVCLTYVKK